MGNPHGAGNEENKMHFRYFSFFLFLVCSYNIFYCSNTSLKVLVIFDRSFYDAFNGADGKSAVEHMREALSILKAAYVFYFLD